MLIMLAERLGPGRPFATKALLIALSTANLVLVGIMIYGFFVSDAGYDWLIFREAGRRVVEGGLYAWENEYAWSYSPLLAYVFTVIAPIGYLGWSVLHVAALLALRDRWLIAITFLSFPFWADLYNGNTMTFVFVAAVGVLRQTSAATAIYLVLCLLMPRPVMLPLLAWVLWRQPAWRTWFAAMMVLNALAVLGTGHGVGWVEALLRVPGAVSVSSRDLGPAVLLGLWWLPLSALLAGVLLLRGRVGFASVAASPYWLPQYFIMLLLELVPQHPELPRSPAAPVREPTLAAE
jgi:hypothetical protein